MNNECVFRICTEDKNRDQILEECSDLFACFAVYAGIGYWHGIEENSLTIEITMPDNAHNRALVWTFARSIKLLNTQEAVLVTLTPTSSYFI